MNGRIGAAMTGKVQPELTEATEGQSGSAANAVPDAMWPAKDCSKDREPR